MFSEHKDTLDYVAERIESELGRPEAVVRIHGGIKRHDRRAVQDRFRVDPTARVLVATDAAGEGVNLQVANMVVNYDLPWNPNRIEQRFGRVHRIGQQRPCHLWNLVAHRTREGKVFERLFAKIEEQRGVYGDQVYDVLGDARINTSLRDLLMRAIASDDDPAHVEWMDEVIDGDIGRQMQGVLDERALVAGLADPTANDKIRRDMEVARARRLQPWFVESFFAEALRLYGGRIAGREHGRFEITRVPAAVRACAEADLGPVHDRYERVTFDKAHVQPERSGGGPSGASLRADLISPGTPLLSAVVNKVMLDFGPTLQQGAVLVDEADPSTGPRLLVYLDHTVTDGREVQGARQTVSRRFHYVEIDGDGNVGDPGDEPYLNYAPLTEDQQALLDGRLDLDWADRTAEETARSWAIEHLAGPHFDEVAAITHARVAKVWDAVRERLESEIRYWDRRTEEVKAQEIAGKKPRLNSGRARARADELETRLARRRAELSREDDLHNSPPTIVAAAVVVPQGLLDELAGPTGRLRRSRQEGRDRPQGRGRGDEGRKSTRPRARGAGPRQPRLRRAVHRPGHRHLLLHRGQGPPAPDRADQRQPPPGRPVPQQPRPLAPSRGLSPRGPRRQPRGPLPGRPLQERNPPPSPNQHPPQRQSTPNRSHPTPLTCPHPVRGLRIERGIVAKRRVVEPLEPLRRERSPRSPGPKGRRVGERPGQASIFVGHEGHQLGAAQLFRYPAQITEPHRGQKRLIQEVIHPLPGGERRAKFGEVVLGVSEGLSDLSGHDRHEFLV